MRDLGSCRNRPLQGDVRKHPLIVRSIGAGMRPKASQINHRRTQQSMAQHAQLAQLGESTEQAIERDIVMQSVVHNSYLPPPTRMMPFCEGASVPNSEKCDVCVSMRPSLVSVVGSGSQP